MLKLLWFSPENESTSSTARHWLFVLFVIASLGDFLFEMIGEYRAGETGIDMIDDLAMLALAVVVAVLIGYELSQNQRALGRLREQLGETRSQLQQVDSRSADLGRQYREVVQKQFDQWKLTESEQQITIALLKGLSFREIAAIRETREKTVRQQATHVYRKSGLKGRHELAAWFFEDLLEPIA